MSKAKIELLERTLLRERKARKQAEEILEVKSLELYRTSKKLKKVNEKLEDLLEKSTSELKGIFEHINDAYVVIDIHGNMLKMNDVASKLFGYNLEEEPLNVYNVIHDKTYALESFNELMEKGQFSNYTARIVTKNKELRWVQANGNLVLDKNNKPIAAQGILRDVTEEKIAEHKLKQSENRLASLITNLDVGFLLEDENREIVLTNNKFCNLFKIPVTPDLLVGQDCTNAAEQSKMLFKNPEVFVKRINVLLKNKAHVVEEEVTMVDGTVLVRDFIPILIEGKYNGHLWVYKDITLKKQYNNSLESQKEKYSNIITNMNLGLLEVCMDDIILMANNSFCEMSGYSEEELIGKVGRKLLAVEKQQKVITLQNKKRQDGESNSYEIDIKNKKGAIRTWLVSGAPNYNLKGELVGSIGIHLDITEFKSLERQKAKMVKELEKSNDELQEYAHVVSHDLKSPLRSIEALTSWIKQDNLDKLDATSLKNFDLVEKTLEKMEQLISNILEYSSISLTPNTHEKVDLNILINDLKDILFVPSNIAINIIGTLPIITCDKIKIQQLFQNLISNAIKFNNKEKGIIEIEAKPDGAGYIYSVKDNGIGIEKQHFDKIFKIFQSLTTHKDSSGIGLSIVKKIIDICKGEIWIESEINKETTFYFKMGSK